MSSKTSEDWHELGRRLAAHEQAAFSDLLLFLDELVGALPPEVDRGDVLLTAARRIEARYHNQPRSSLIASLKAYGATVLQRCRDRLRLERRSRASDPLRGGAVGSHLIAASPEYAAGAQELAAGVVRCLERLAARERELIVLVDARGMSVPEVTAFLRGRDGEGAASVRAIESQVRRARESFRSLLIDQGLLEEVRSRDPDERQALVAAFREELGRHPDLSTLLSLAICALCGMGL